jgi:hypothetical protein
VESLTVRRPTNNKLTQTQMATDNKGDTGSRQHGRTECGQNDRRQDRNRKCGRSLLLHTASTTTGWRAYGDSFKSQLVDGQRTQTLTHSERETERERARLHRNVYGDRDGAECPITKNQTGHPLPNRGCARSEEGTTSSPL